MDPEVQELPPRALAMEMAAATDHFGPFLADLAERSLMGVESGPPRFTALLIHPPVDLAPEAAHTLVVRMNGSRTMAASASGLRGHCPTYSTASKRCT
jgi:hypothetical protein